MASGYASAVSAVQVGSYFVGQYYKILQQQPDFAHQFYTDTSTVIWVDGDSSESASTMLQIHTLMVSLNFTGIEIKTINSLESWSGGVLVVVSGSVRAKDFSGSRKFVQTFLLAPQEKGYFVLNDIFHFINEDEVHQRTVPIMSENEIDPQLLTSTLHPEPPVSEYDLDEEASEYVNSIHIEGHNPVDEYTLQEQQQQQGPEADTVLEETPAEEPSTLLQNVVEAIPDTLHSVEEPVGEPPKFTYASILRAPKGQSVPSVVSRPSLIKSTPPASDWHHPQPASQQLNVPETSLEASEENPSLEEGELKSVYVRNLPSTISAADIELEFKTFGRILPDGVFIRNRKDIGVCYAFVEFEDLHAVQNAIKASPIQLAGRQVYIEERRANIGGASRGGSQGFATGRIRLGQIEVVKITKFESIWEYNFSEDKRRGITFYKPVGIPDGFCSLGDYCQSNDQPLQGFVLVAREVDLYEPQNSSIWHQDQPPALLKPLDYTLVWISDDGSEENLDGRGYFWLPQPPEGYKAMGFVVTHKSDKPKLEDVRCVRADLTDKCETYCLILDTNTKFSKLPFRVWSTRPSDRGMIGTGVSVGTFFCSSYWSSGEEPNIACLKNLNPTLNAMPNFDQIHALIRHYGPTVFFHPDEVYLPSSVSWFFKNGALLYKRGESVGEAIDAAGLNLPGGGTNDGAYWIDLPNDDRRKIVKRGDLESAVLYVHVKPALGGTFTDIVMWVFCPFNGPATLKVGIMNVALTKIGKHVCDWEHFTLRVSNFTGELWSIYFSQHSGGEWVDASDLEFIEGNKAIVYSSKSGHASFAHPGSYIQGSTTLGIGVRNDAARSNYYVDSSVHYEIIAAEYLGGEGTTSVKEPCWLQYMRKWGPTVVYDSRTELDKFINVLPLILRYSVANIFDKFPVELYGEDGPTGPKEKNNWVGDERS